MHGHIVLQWNLHVYYRQNQSQVSWFSQVSCMIFQVRDQYSYTKCRCLHFQVCVPLFHRVWDESVGQVNWLPFITDFGCYVCSWLNNNSTFPLAVCTCTKQHSRVGLHISVELLIITLLKKLSKNLLSQNFSAGVTKCLNAKNNLHSNVDLTFFQIMLMPQSVP